MAGFRRYPTAESGSRRSRLAMAISALDAGELSAETEMDTAAKRQRFTFGR